MRAWPNIQIMSRTVDSSFRRTGATIGGLLLCLTATYDGIGALPGEFKQTTSSSQSRTGQQDPTDRLAADQAARLEALGYLQGSVEATNPGGVSTYVPEKSFEGFNLYVSGHAPAAILMDMEGNPLHTWHYKFADVWEKYPGKINQQHKFFWRRVHLFENGDLLAIFEGIGMIMLDRNSRLLWKSGLGQHHDIAVDENGDIYVLTRESKIIPRISERKPVIEDSITIMSPTGSPLLSISLIEALERFQDIALYWNRAKQRKGDIFHTNSLEILDGSAAHRNPAFAKGNVLVSMRSLDAVFIVNPITKKVVWGFAEDFVEPHDPQVLPNGNLLVFDNLGGSSKRGRSRMLEYGLPGMNLVWTYEGTSKERFFTKGCGMAQRLPNQNTLITETDYGRAFEVTPEGEIVWQFFNPFRAGPGNSRVASLFALDRISPEYVPWLQIDRPQK